MCSSDLIAHNAREQRRGTLQLADQIVAEFILDGPVADAVLGKRAVAKSAKSAGQIPGGFSQLPTPFAQLYQTGSRTPRGEGEFRSPWLVGPGGYRGWWLYY